jgi:hypothetical protein
LFELLTFTFDPMAFMGPAKAAMEYVGSSLHKDFQLQKMACISVYGHAVAV